MARPRTKSKPKPKPAKPEPEIAPVRVGRCTGLEVPEAKAEKIAAAHMAGMSIREICRAFSTSYNTTIALIRNRPELLERAREAQARIVKTRGANISGGQRKRKLGIIGATDAVVSCNDRVREDQ
jgi:hypothetical protein